MIMTTPFLLFYGPTFYAAGGWRDFVGAYATLRDAQEAAVALWSKYHDWYEIIDLFTMAVVEEDGWRGPTE
jgi:hypothetical protein